MSVPVRPDREKKSGAYLSTQRLQTIFNSLATGIAIISRERIVTEVNPALETMLGYDKGELTGKHVSSISVAEDEEKNLGLFLRLQRREIPSFRMEKRYFRKDGSIIWGLLTVAPIIDQDNKIEAYAGLIDDITEQKDALFNLAAEKKLYQNLIETVSAIAWELNLATKKFTYVSPQAADILGFALDQWKDMNSWAAMIHADDREEAVAYCQRATEKGLDHEFEYRMVAADGRTVWIREVVDVFKRDGIPAMLRGFMFDVSAQKEIGHYHERLRTLEGLGLLAGGIAHDFNNLLTSIFGNIELAMLQAQRGSTIQHLLHNCLQAMDKAKNLTGQLLTFAKGGTPVKTRASLGIFLQQTISSLAIRKPHTIDLQIPDDLEQAEFDPDQIHRVLNNLIENAMEAMPKGGTITVTASNIQAGDLDKNIPLPPNTSYVKISVADLGSGISSDIKEKIFDPYFTTKDKGAQRGMGLGLSICHSIVEKHGGYITVSSSSGRGSTFSFFLPSCTGIEDPAAKPRPTVREERSRPRILLLDDDQTVADIAAEMIRQLGYDVEHVLDGKDAVRLYKEALGHVTPYAVVILDLVIPRGLGGKATLEELMKIDPQVKAVAISGYSDDPLVTAPKEHGFMAAFEKPFRLSSMKQILDSLCSS